MFGDAAGMIGGAFLAEGLGGDAVYEAADGCDQVVDLSSQTINYGVAAVYTLDERNAQGSVLLVRFAHPLGMRQL